MTTPTQITVPTEIKAAIDNGAVIAISMSGGKDSQAMASAVVRYLYQRGLNNRVVAVHADLGRAEWFDTDETLRRQVDHMGLELTIVQRAKGDLLQRIQERAEKVGAEKVFWPSSAARYCTSDLKRNPIDKFLRTLGPLVISCEGLRRDESAARAKKPCWEPRKQITNSKRDALTWRPIHFWTTEDVWVELLTSGAELEWRRMEYSKGNEEVALDGWPAHAAYVRGNERLSCSICILASKSDIENGARHNPDYLAELVALEEEYGYTFKADFSLVELAKKIAADSDRNDEPTTVEAEMSFDDHDEPEPPLSEAERVQESLLQLTTAQHTTARHVLANARRDLGEDLGGFSAVDLLLDNMAELDVDDARALLTCLDGYDEPSRLTWGERRALGVECDLLSDLDGPDMDEEQLDRLQELETILAANPLGGYSSEEIDKYNVFHFGDASGRGPRIHRTVQTFSDATGLSVEMIQAHKITSYCSATGNPIHVLEEEGTFRSADLVDLTHGDKVAGR